MLLPLVKSDFKVVEDGVGTGADRYSPIGF